MFGRAGRSLPALLFAAEAELETDVALVVVEPASADVAAVVVVAVVVAVADSLDLSSLQPAGRIASEAARMSAATRFAFFKVEHPLKYICKLIVQ